TAQVASLILDGERPVGDRASNRSIALDVIITAPTRDVLAAAREMLLQAIDAPDWLVRWTREGGPTPVLDCYRPSATVLTYSLNRARQVLSEVALSFQAAPYGRSDTPVTFESPTALTGKTAPPGPLLIDDFTTVTGTNWTQSPIGPGPQSAHWTPPG